MGWLYDCIHFKKEITLDILVFDRKIQTNLSRGVFTRAAGLYSQRCYLKKNSPPPLLSSNCSKAINANYDSVDKTRLISKCLGQKTETIKGVVVKQTGLCNLQLRHISAIDTTELKHSAEYCCEYRA